MAGHSNRSPSPISSRQNPNPKTPDSITSNVRKSFSGNPCRPSAINAHPRRSFRSSTPANSPSDCGRRSVVSWRNCDEHKENEKDSNAKPSPRLRSPVVPPKGSKNFMCPTISAASKIAAASPRKKILSERNQEPARASFSSSSEAKRPFGSRNSDSSETMMVDFDLNPEIGFDSNEVEVAISDGAKFGANLDSSKNSESLAETVTEELESCAVNVDTKTHQHRSSVSSSSSSLSTIISPLDADPSLLPPYDPVTNYLSPRPQFLRYRPRPQMEAFLSHRSHLFGLDCFAEFENMDGTESEIESENLQEAFEDCAVEAEEITRSPKDSGVASEPKIPVVSEVNSMKTQSIMPSCDEKDEEITHFPKYEDGVSEPKVSVAFKVNSRKTKLPKDDYGVAVAIASDVNSRKTQFWVRSKSRSISVLLIFVLACLSISSTDSPVIIHTTFKDQTFPNVSYVAKFAEANLNGFMLSFKKIGLRSAHSAFHLSKLISNLWEEADLLGIPVNGNLTNYHEEIYEKGECDCINQKQEGFEKGPLREQVHISIHPHIPEAKQIEEESRGNRTESHDDLIPFFEPPRISEDTSVEMQEDWIVGTQGEVIPVKAPKTSAQVESVSDSADMIETQEDLIPFFEPPRSSEDRSVEMQEDWIVGTQGEVIPVKAPKTSAQVESLSDSADMIEIQEDLIPFFEPPRSSEDRSVEMQEDWIVGTQGEVIPVKAPKTSAQEESVSDSADMIEIQEELIPISQASPKMCSEEKSSQNRIENQDLILKSQAPELRSEDMSATVEILTENDLNPAVQIELIQDEVINPSNLDDADSEVADVPDMEDSREYLNFKNMVGIIIIWLLTAITAAAAMRLKKNYAKESAPNAVIPTLSKKSVQSPKNKEALSMYRNWPTELDVVGESYQSEIIKKGRQGVDEAGNHSRKLTGRSYMNESFDSSDNGMCSSDSPSLGSFTTYEKIASKYGEEEVVTPVRRSSRIRKQVTSP